MANDYYDNSDPGQRLQEGTTARGGDVDAKLDAVQVGFEKLPAELEIKQGRINYAVDSGAANAAVVALTYAPPAYVDGLEVVFKAAATNTGAMTVNVNALGAKAVVRRDGTALLAGDVVAGEFVYVRYNGTAFCLTAPTEQMVGDATTAQAAAEAAQSYAEEWANKAEDTLVSAAAGGDQIDDYSALHHRNKSAASAANAATSEANALAHETKASQWAQHPDNTDIPGEAAGTYSAKHWAGVSQAAATGDLSYKGSHDASGGLYPTTPALGDYWKISVAGTLPGGAVNVGDSIIYNGTSWDHLDNADAVLSVDGRTGTVTLGDLYAASGHNHAATYLGISAKAADSELLDGLDSTQFLRSDTADSKTAGGLTFNDNVYCYFGTGNDVGVFFNGSNLYADLTMGNWYVRDGATTRFTFARTTGDFTATGNITAYSDITVKANIEVIPDALLKVMQLGGYTYDRTDAEVPRQTGVIAQEVREVLPEAVIEMPDGTLAVAYGNMVGLLIQSIKELKGEVDALKARIEG